MNKKEGLALLLAFLFYLAIGGVIFMYIEKHQGSDLSEDKFKELAAEEIRNLTQSTVNETELESTLDNLLEICTASAHEETETPWTFYDAFFFAMTVITTIGYGHLVPKTPGGQIICIFYALVGIPMTGILVANFGNFFSSILLRAHERSKTERYNSTLALIVNTVSFLIPGTIVFLCIPAVVFTFLEDWTYLQSFYYAFITLTTIGFGDLVAGTSEKEELAHRWIYKVGLMTWIIFGLGYLAMILNFISRAMKSKHVQKINKTVGRGFQKTHQMISKEMEEFIRSMNRIAPKPEKKLKRTMSLPLMNNARSLNEVGRTYSDSQLLKQAKKDDDGDYMMQQQAQTNTMGFIFQLAKAFAFADLDPQQTDRLSIHSFTGGRQPSLVEILAEAVIQASRRNSSVDKDLFLESQAAWQRRSWDASNFSRIPGSTEFIGQRRTSAWLEIPQECYPRRKSDFGCYLDLTRVSDLYLHSPKPQVPVLEEVDETEAGKPSPLRRVSSKENGIASRPVSDVVASRPVSGVGSRPISEVQPTPVELYIQEENDPPPPIINLPSPAANTVSETLQTIPLIKVEPDSRPPVRPRKHKFKTNPNRGKNAFRHSYPSRKEYKNEENESTHF